MASAPTAERFVMHGARAAIAGGMLHIGEQVRAIELAVDENPGLAFDLARTLIESTCRTILTERGITFDPADELPKLFKHTAKHLPFLPSAASGEAQARKSLERTLSGLHTSVQGVCELRNACGFASHGSERTKPALETVQAILVAETSDAIVGFLHRVHVQDRMPPPNSQAKEYEEHIDFNDYVDEIHEPVQIFDVEFKPSEILFQMEPESYRVYLAEFEPEPAADDAPSGADS